jgi:biopolymer transport protein TolR
MPRGRRGRHRYELNADVNVVSLIDVMLLLLVIFMITAPMMQGGVDISLPVAQSRPLESKDGLAVTVNSKGEIFIGNEKFSLGDFRVSFKTVAQNRTRNGVYLRADKGVEYGLVVQILAIMRGNGVADVGLVTEPEVIR